MRRNWNKTSSFAHFDVSLENVQWSWSGVSNDGSTVAVVLWQDRVKGRDGQLVYLDNQQLDAEWRNRTGNRRRIAHLKYAQDCLGSKFRGIIAKAVNVDSDPREIGKCFPQPDVFWVLDSLDEVTGAFTAHVIQKQ